MLYCREWTMWLMFVTVSCAEWTLGLNVYPDVMCRVDCVTICTVRPYRVEHVTECLCYRAEWTISLRV